MASPMEQLAANLDLGTFTRAKDLQRRVVFLLMALVVYRFGTYLSVPGVSADYLYDFFFSASSGNALNLFNLFSGGAAARGSIFALNVVPYISASIIIQLMTAAVPSFEQLKKEGERGRTQLNQYTRYLTLLLAALQAFTVITLLRTQPGAITTSGWFFTLSTIITLVGGTMFLVWLGEQISVRGVGNGISVLIFAGIVAEFPAGFQALVAEGRTSGGQITLIILIILLATLFIVFMERAQRRLTIQYPRRQVGTRMAEGSSSHLPIKLNSAGVIPPIFASSLLLVPATFAGVGGTAAGGDSGVLSLLAAYLGRGQPLYLLLFGLMVLFFTFFYTSIVFNPDETAENLRKQGGFIPGYRPGPGTAAYIDYVLTRITTVGAIYLTVIVIVPEMFATSAAGIFFGGASLLIVVNVSLDLVTRFQGHLLSHQYENLIRKASFRSGGGKRRR